MPQRDGVARIVGVGPKRDRGRGVDLERAMADPDGFVRKKAEEALSGKTKSEF